MEQFPYLTLRRKGEDGAVSDLSRCPSSCFKVEKEGECSATEVRQFESQTACVFAQPEVGLLKGVFDNPQKVDSRLVRWDAMGVREAVGGPPGERRGLGPANRAIRVFGS